VKTPGECGSGTRSEHPYSNRVTRFRSAEDLGDIHIHSIRPAPPGDGVLPSPRAIVDALRVRLRTRCAIRLRSAASHSELQAVRGRTSLEARREWPPCGLISPSTTAPRLPNEKESRGAALETHLARTRDSQRRLHEPRSRTRCPRTGNHPRRSRRHWRMGYGNLPNFNESTSWSCHVVARRHLGKNVQDFRSYLSPLEAPSPRG